MEAIMLFMGIPFLVLCLCFVVFAHKTEARLHELRKKVHHLDGFRRWVEFEIKKLEKNK